MRPASFIARLFGRKAEPVQDWPSAEWEAEQRAQIAAEIESPSYDPQEFPDGTRGCINAHNRDRSGPRP